MDKQSKQESWFDHLTRKIGEFFSNGNTPNCNSTEPKEINQIANKANTKAQLEDKKPFVDAVCSTLTNLIEDPESTKGKKLVIWLDTDNLTFGNYATASYISGLQAVLTNQCGFGFEKIEFKNGIPSDNERATPIGNSGKGFMQVLANQPIQTTVICRARISIWNDEGCLLKEQYILSSDEMQEKGFTAYNIGSGQYPQGVGNRENHIAIDDNQNSPHIEQNKYVSRMHAHIGFSDTFGFYLQVERNGTRVMGKRTRILRGNEKIECDNISVPYILHTGDLIELGKAVVLKYEQLND